MARARPPRLLPVKVTELEMRAIPPRRDPAPSGPRIALMRAAGMTPAFYRFLYREVGKPHHWFVRRELDDASLLADLAPEKTELFVLYIDGCPAGFFELALSGKPKEVEITYFGLMPAYQGRGLGKFFLSEAVFAAWAHGPEKIVIETNTLDSARAIIMYQRMGFTAVRQRDEKVPAWE
jgi:ribosomal protein S18 acetylase RimI-like enzyme